MSILTRRFHKVYKIPLHFVAFPVGVCVCDTFKHSLLAQAAHCSKLRCKFQKRMLVEVLGLASDRLSTASSNTTTNPNHLTKTAVNDQTAQAIGGQMRSVFQVRLHNGFEMIGAN